MTVSDPRFFNRELSWLEFNQRVLDEARDVSIPLLERLKFVAITASNLDEFFMVRVGGLQSLAEAGSQSRDPSGMTPNEQLLAVSDRTRRFTREQYECYFQQIEPGLSKAGIQCLHPETLSALQEQHVQQVFVEEVFSTFAPLMVTSASVDEFPLLLNRSMSVCVRLRRPRADRPDEFETRYAVIPFGRTRMRFVTLPSAGSYCYVLLEEVIAHCIRPFFPMEDVLECSAFRITRNADLAIREDQASDLLSEMQHLLAARKGSDCVRLEIADSASQELVGFLQQALEVADRDVYRLPGPLDLSAFMQLVEIGTGTENRYESWPAKHSPLIDPQENVFEAITRGDVLLNHPYESFDPVVRLVEQAAIDPDVMAIKQILYRTSRKSPIVAALARAAQNGKHVTVIVELKARFDEERNIEWARSLEQAGVQVFYGVKGLKTHAKVCIVVRREPQGIQRYVHFGTGNYNETTARLYSDISLLTCDESLGHDAVSFFNAVTGYSQPLAFRRIAAAPFGLRDRLVEMVEAEIQFKKQRQRAEITIKVNSLVDPGMIELLYKASQSGVKVRLNVRGICCLRPGVPGLSENIEVVSIVDRYLEHARVLFFHHGGDQRVFISSADWMTRNLDRRVELLVPIEDDACRLRLIGILDSYFKDRAKGRQLQSDGHYKLPAKKPSTKLRAQEWLYQETCRIVEHAEYSKQTVFQPHHAPD